MSTHRDVDDDQILAIIEALRHYLSGRGHDGRTAAQLAEEWRRGQLFPPTVRDLDRALALMNKTARGTARV